MLIVFAKYADERVSPVRGRLSVRAVLLQEAGRRADASVLSES